MKTNVFRRSAVLLAALLLLTGCGTGQNIMIGESAADTAAVQMTENAEPAADTETAADTVTEAAAPEEPFGAAYAVLTGFLDGCIAGDMTAILSNSDMNCRNDVSLAYGNTSHITNEETASSAAKIIMTSYSVEGVRHNAQEILERFASEADYYRKQAQDYRENPAPILMYPEYFDRAADNLSAVTDGYTFEIIAEPGIHTEIPVVLMDGSWRADVWIIGSLSALQEQTTEPGTEAGEP